MTEKELVKEVAKIIKAGQKKKWLTKSFVIAIWMLSLTTVVSAATLYLMYLCVIRNYTGQLVALSALITLCQAGTAVVLSKITDKSKAENTKGGITFETAVQNGERDL